MEDASGEGEHEGGLGEKDPMNQARWRVSVREIAAGVNLATPFTGINPDQNWIDDVGLSENAQGENP